MSIVVVDFAASRHVRARSGAVLIVVAGLSAIVATLALTFLVRMRSDIEESRRVVRDAQARLMLSAACCYVLEAGRLGLDQRPADPPSDTVHEEGFGWIDVRDGSLGPKSALAASASYPLGWVARCPMTAWRRPPFAIAATVSPNAMQQDPTRPDFAMPYLRNPDPVRPVDDWGTWIAGDPRPRLETLGVAWFRVRRTDDARFTITCGAGATQGYQDWQDVINQGATESFGSRATFDALLADEERLWYRIEWSAAVGGATYQCVDNETGPDHYQWRPFNPVHEWWPGGHQSQPHARNLVGTIRWIQRLREPPISRLEW